MFGPVSLQHLAVIAHPGTEHAHRTERVEMNRGFYLIRAELETVNQSSGTNALREDGVSLAAALGEAEWDWSSAPAGPCDGTLCSWLCKAVRVRGTDLDLRECKHNGRNAETDQSRPTVLPRQDSGQVFNQSGIL